MKANSKYNQTVISPVTVGERIYTSGTSGNDFLLEDIKIEAEKGGRKNDDGKLRYDLISTVGLRRLAEAYTIGANKPGYGDNNWRKGLRWGRLFASLMRHAWAWWTGERDDPADGQHHLASVAWIAFALMEYEECGIGEDDRWKKYSVPCSS